MNSEHINFSQITEKPGSSATEEQIKRLYQRYQFVRNEVDGKDVCEVACGTGIGLTFLAEKANSLTGCDIDEVNIRIAKKNISNSKFAEKIHIDIMDAHYLNFPDNSFDIVLIFEAIYYLSDPDRFFTEANRVLRRNGKLIICSVNREWRDFHPSPFTFSYYSIHDFKTHLVPLYKQISFFGGFPIQNISLKNIIFSFIKRISVKLNLIPDSLDGRAYLKRIFIGKLIDLPNELTEDFSKYTPPVQIFSTDFNKSYIILYVVANKI